MVILLNEIGELVNNLVMDCENYKEYQIELDVERRNFDEVIDLK